MPLSNPMADAPARATALDPTRSFIVQAPAGSGKTGLLTQRLLTLLARVDHPEEVVAITFTRKAAAEMRQRVLEALAAASGPVPDDAHKAQSWRLAQAVLRRDQDRGWQIVNAPSRLRILTIDGLCTSLVRQAPILSGFGGQTTILEQQGETLYRLAARAALRELEGQRSWSGAIAQLLEHLDNNAAYLESLLATMLARRDQWLRHMVGDHLEREALEEVLRQTVSDRLAATLHEVPESLLELLPPLARFAAARLDEEGRDDPWIGAWLLQEEFPDDRVTELTAWKGVVHLLQTAAGSWRKPKGLNKNIGFPPESAGQDRVEKALFRDSKLAMGELLEELATEERLRVVLNEVRTLPEPCYSDGQWRILEALAALLPMAVGQLQLLFAHEGGVDFSEVALRALAALGEPGLPSDLALRLDYRIQHLLVDEFQDTSLSQFYLLERLVEGWTPSDGRTLFLVGDPMQSIYRFREADVGLFLRVWQDGINGMAVEPLRLQVNFRSTPGIVDWVNAGFSRIFPDHNDPNNGAVRYAPAQPNKMSDSIAAVTCHPVRKEDEADAVAATALAISQTLPGASIAILVRARSHLQTILPALSRQGIRFQAVEIDRLSERQTVLDLKALTLALCHLAERTSWLALLRAPWCGLLLADLLPLATEARRTIWGAMNDPAVLAQLSADGKQRVQRVRQVLTATLAERRRVGLRQWVEGAWLALGGAAVLRDDHEVAEAEAFFSLLDELDTGGEVTDFALLEARIATLFAPVDQRADGGVQVMTIHKAKGLEFDAVLLPGLHRLPPGRKRSLLTWMERPTEEGEGLLLAPLPAVGVLTDPLYAFVQQLDQKKERFETGRLLYVAATRAKRALHLFGGLEIGEEGVVVAPKENTLLGLLWPVVQESFADQPGTTTPAPTDTTPPDWPRLHRLPSGWTLPPPPSSLGQGTVTILEREAPVIFDWAGETARLIGTVTHRFLHLLASDGAAAWSEERLAASQPAIRAHLTRLGLQDSEALAASRVVENALRNTLNHPIGRWILDGRHREAHSEWALTGVMAGRIWHLVMDRVFVDNDGVQWIIDYKTSQHSGSDLAAFLDNEQLRYRPQLERYASLLATTSPHPIRLGLFFPLLGQWRCWEWSLEQPLEER